MPQTAVKRHGDEQARWVTRWVPQGLWLGPLVVFVGAVSYFVVFARYPWLRDVPWLNLPLVWVGLVWTAVAVWHNWQAGPGMVRRWLGVIGLGFSLFLALVFHWYVFVYSNQMPTPAVAWRDQQAAPAFALNDADGRQVQLSDFRGSKVILVFYRGHW